MVSKQPESSAASRLHVYSGRPAMARRFLPGMDFEPPRKGSKATQRISRESLRSQGKNTPFLGQELPGRVRYTLIDGHLAYDGSWT